MKIKIPAIALAALLFTGLPLASSSAYVGISVAIAPPAIPVYEQPLCPTEGYLWTPGYWAYADVGYYWVPGVWVAPPRVGVLWTPGYWGYRGGHYIFNEGYWGPTVGFYGGINYGFGYGGRGYYGGEWAGDSFRYNTAVTRVNSTVIHNTYINKEAVKNNTGSRASFNGPGGAKAKPTAQEQAAAKAEHVPPTAAQQSRVEAAKNDPALHAKNNHGKPKAAAEAAGAAGAPKQTTNKTQTGAAEQAGAGKRENGGRVQGAFAESRVPASGRAAKAIDRPAAKTAGAPHAQHAQTAARAPRAVRPEHAAPAGRGRGPAQGPQNSKKKKRDKEKPGGQ